MLALILEVRFTYYVHMGGQIQTPFHLTSFCGTLTASLLSLFLIPSQFPILPHHYGLTSLIVTHPRPCIWV